MHEKLYRLYTRIKKSQDNIDIVLESIRVWDLTPSPHRRDDNHISMLDIDCETRDLKCKDRDTEVNNSKKLIAIIVEENYRLLFGLPSLERQKKEIGIDRLRSTIIRKFGRQQAKAKIERMPSVVRMFQKDLVMPNLAETDKNTNKSEDNLKLFRPYQEYVDKLVAQAIIKSIESSLAHILNEMNHPEDNGSPRLFHIKLQLWENELQFIPDLMNENDNGSFMNIIKRLINDICMVSNQIDKIAPPPSPLSSAPSIVSKRTYHIDLNESRDIQNLRDMILLNVRNACDEALKYMNQFKVYEYIWLEDKECYLNRFLNECKQNCLTNDDYPENSVSNTNAQIDLFQTQIECWLTMFGDFEKLTNYHAINGWLLIDLRSLKHMMLNQCSKWVNTFKDHLLHYVLNRLNEFEHFIDESNEILLLEFEWDDSVSLLKILATQKRIAEYEPKIMALIPSLKKIIYMIMQYDVPIPKKCIHQFSDLPEKWSALLRESSTIKYQIVPIQAYQHSLIEKRIVFMNQLVAHFRHTFQGKEFFSVQCQHVYELLDESNDEIHYLEIRLEDLIESAIMFGLTLPSKIELEKCQYEIKLAKQLWDFVNVVESCVCNWKKTAWKRLDVEEIEQQCKKFTKDIRLLGKLIRTWQPFVHIERILRNLVTSLRAITELQNTAIKDRHWLELMKSTGLFAKFGMIYLLNIRLNKTTTLSDLLNLGLHEFEDEVKQTVDKAVKEMQMEKILRDIETQWTTLTFDYEVHPNSGLKLVKASEDLIEKLEENQIQIQNMATSKYMSFFEKEINDWIHKLGIADMIIVTWTEVQRKWTYLESIFRGSEDIRKQLPIDSERFMATNVTFHEVLGTFLNESNILMVTNRPKLHDKMEEILLKLIMCEKALNNYLETKRTVYPRFYFISSIDLLDILSNCNDPIVVGRHLPKLYDSIKKLIYHGNSKMASGMCSKDHDEYVPFSIECNCIGKVEDWLNHVTNVMRFTLNRLFEQSIECYEDKSRKCWIFDWPAQVALCISQITWSSEINEIFKKIEEGYENALKDYQRKQIAQLNALIGLLLGDLSSGDRQKIMTICTIDVHSRDVVSKMITQKVMNASSFQWQSQLRHRWDRNEKECYVNICDAEFKYDYEYLGITPRLVITPLTDRCYITLTQSLHLIYYGAPAGPSGTGKTETTKDLAKGLGMMVYVFNCSEMLDYKSCGQIYKGLASTGAFGIFDEFNRISIEVLSVVAVQVKCIQNAIKNNKSTFMFMGDLISLVPTVGIFITLNPNYAGRNELPENLKSVFRPCAMVVPDFALICEIMLVAEGFQEARILARKFITLYTLCRELLSKQDHYDWGLRAIKSVLVVAGTLKRSDRQRPEEQVLMRALRDFNIPKIVTDDIPVFMGLIGDLFPSTDVPRKRSSDFEKLIKKSSLALNLEAEDGFILKVVQLEELLAVRHSVFIVGDACTGKSQIWKTLNATYVEQGRKTIVNDLNPKSVSNNELFGFVNTATREWKDGLLSSLIRDQAESIIDGPKWIISDGDIDPMWIESLNTVMDDNKVLTLASNERIALTADMRLLFEVGHLKGATPATVSRAGILYVNDTVLGWYPIVASWLKNRMDTMKVNDLLLLLFDRYIPPLLDASKKFNKITPITDISLVQMTCNLLDCLLTSDNQPDNSPKEWYEIYFIFAAIWGFGSSLHEDQQTDWRAEFSKFWTSEFPNVHFPENACVFDYFVDNTTKQFKLWSDLVPKYEIDTDTPLQSTLIPTATNVCLRWFLDKLLDSKQPIMFIGVTGSGKTVTINDKLAILNDNFSVAHIPLNYYTTSEMLQKRLEKPLEKKAGKSYAPIGSKNVIYFIDDLNMPEKDSFGTVGPHQIIRQFMDYGHWYDRSKLTLKEIKNCLFLTCMNPTTGSFHIDARLQRHFFTFAVNFPSDAALFHIYHTILSQHLANDSKRFTVHHKRICETIVNMGLNLHSRITQCFLPTALKFHYIFNLRDLANIYQGLLFATKETCPEYDDLAKLYVHEAFRVYSDKLIDDSDQDAFRKLIREVFKKYLEEIDDVKIFREPLIYCHFADGLNEPKYMEIKNWSTLTNLLLEAMNGYNEYVGQMNLVLFEDAMAHICRINRILETPCGNALLIGVGGSGKQSLARISAFISSLSVYQIQLRKGYTINDLRSDLNTLYQKVGIKNMSIMFLLTDAQVADESFLVLINDLLASGEIPDLFTNEETDNIISSVKNEIKQLGIMDTRENCWKYFIEKVKKMLKVVLCFSPVGSTLRRRARKFPALVNCTAINFFNEWPKVALESVAKKFLLKVNVLPPHLTESVAVFMAYVLNSVNEVSKNYSSNEKRYNYTTPKSYLELISLYSKLLTEKTDEHLNKIQRLENGLIRLAQCAQQVDLLKV